MKFDINYLMPELCEGTEEEIDKMIELLEANVLDPNVSDYIFYDDLSAEEVVDKCLAYKPIILPTSYET